MTQEEMIQAISDDKTMPFIQPEQLAEIVDFVIKNYNPFLDSLPEQPVEGLEEDLKKEITRTYHDGSVADTSDMDHNDYENIARHFAEWKAEKDKEIIEVAEDHAYFAGSESMREKVISIIKSRISEILGDAQPNPVLRMELQGIIDKIKNCI